MNYSERFRNAAISLRDTLLDGRSFEQLQTEAAKRITHTEAPVFAAFISVCNKKERAKVFRCSADNISDAWDGVCEAAEKFVSSHEYEPAWIKADIIRNSEKALFTDVVSTIAKGYNEFFRRGISFDDRLDTALIEAEINGSRVISYKKHMIELNVVNRYLSKNGIRTISGFPEYVVLFDCFSAFYGDEGTAMPLYSDGPDIGRRVINGIDKDITKEIITTSSAFLSMMIGLDGKFDYGFYPVYHKEISGYNIMRHASSIWSLICAYRLTGDSFIMQQAEKAIAYMVDNTYNKYNLPEEQENTVYLAETIKNEVKAGANGVAIIMLTEYMDVTGDRRLEKICKELGNGILELLDERTGELFHVLHFPSLAPKDKFRTVFYDGECVFALCRLYGLTRERRWLDAAERMVGRFIREDYTQYTDHWIAYAMNEITKYAPKEKYFEFGLKNAQVNLRKIYKKKTTYHTLLELLAVTFELYDRIIKKGIKVRYLEEFDTPFFIKTIFRRAEHMLNGYGYPEYTMYFKYPERALGAFFVRHDGYRIRIDDIQHFCGAYYSFYRNYEKLCALRNNES